MAADITHQECAARAWERACAGSSNSARMKFVLTGPHSSHTLKPGQSECDAVALGANVRGPLAHYRELLQARGASRRLQASVAQSHRARSTSSARRMTSGSAISVPQRAPARPCALESVRRIARFGACGRWRARDSRAANSTYASSTTTSARSGERTGDPQDRIRREQVTGRVVR